MAAQSRRKRLASERPWKPTKVEIAAAKGGTLPDLIRPGLRVLFVGINPSLYSAAIGHHFGRPGNRFWPTLHGAGFTSRLLSPFDERELLEAGYGISNIVARATASAAELTDDEIVRGGRRVLAKVRRHRPAFVAFLGVTSYRTALGRRLAQIGRQTEPFGPAALWVLPNPSGLNAHYQRADLAQLFAELRGASG
jgi:double-stranded uracil-DNA glycosylase